MQTLEEVQASNKIMLTPFDIAPILKCDPHSIRTQARVDPEKLGFPVIIMGTRIRIPRDAFVFYQKYGDKLCLKIDEVR